MASCTPDFIPGCLQLSIAPMLECTDDHFRYLARLITHKTELWTEMIVDQAIIFNQAQVLRPAQPYERPIVVQLGGSNPETLAQAAKMCQELGYDEINLNVGCPSAKVVNKKDAASCFGAKLMLDPPLVARCVAAMRAVVSIPVTVKCRIGVDKVAEYSDLVRFINCVHEQGGVTRFTVHARRALLKGLSAHENRTIPPLNHPYVYRLKKDFPHLDIDINGGITTFDQVYNQVGKVDGVMIGRQAYKNPWMFANVDAEMFNSSNPASCRRSVILQYARYMQDIIDKKVTLDGMRPRSLITNIQTMYKPLAGVLYGVRGERKFRKFLDHTLIQWRSEALRSAQRGDHSSLPCGGSTLPWYSAVLEALTKVSQKPLDEPPQHSSTIPSFGLDAPDTNTPAASSDECRSPPIGSLPSPRPSTSSAGPNISETEATIDHSLLDPSTSPCVPNLQTEVEEASSVEPTASAADFPSLESILDGDVRENANDIDSNHSPTKETPFRASVDVSELTPGKSLYIPPQRSSLSSLTEVDKSSPSSVPFIFTMSPFYSSPHSAFETDEVPRVSDPKTKLSFEEEFAFNASGIHAGTTQDFIANSTSTEKRNIAEDFTFSTTLEDGEDGLSTKGNIAQRRSPPPPDFKPPPPQLPPPQSTSPLRASRSPRSTRSSRSPQTLRPPLSQNSPSPLPLSPVVKSRPVSGTNSVGRTETPNVPEIGSKSGSTSPTSKSLYSNTGVPSVVLEVSPVDCPRLEKSTQDFRNELEGATLSEDGSSCIDNASAETLPKPKEDAETSDSCVRDVETTDTKDTTLSETRDISSNSERAAEVNVESSPGFDELDDLQELEDPSAKHSGCSSVFVGCCGSLDFVTLWST